MSDDTGTTTPVTDAGEPPAPPTPPVAPPAPPTPPTPSSDADAAMKAALVKATAEAEQWKTLAQRHEKRARGNADAAAELARIQRENQSEQDRIVADAQNAVRAELRQQFGAQLVRAEMRAASAGRLDTDRLDRLLERIDVTSFMEEDGTLKTADIASFVETVAPPPPPPPAVTPDTGAPPAPAVPGRPDLGQGARGSDAALNGDPLLGSLKHKLGIV